MTIQNNVIDISKHLNEVRKNHRRQPAKGSFAKSSCNRLSAKVRQYDCLINAKTARGINPDDDGDCMLYVNTDELMIGSDVRVLIKTDTAPEDVIRALLKITQWIVSIEKYNKETEEFDLPF